MMDFAWLSRWQPQLLAILRIVVGLLFLEHALIKLAGFPPGGKPGLQDVGTFLWIAGVVELVTSVLVVLGLFTRFAAFVAAGEMAIAYWTVHAKMGLSRRQHGRRGNPFLLRIPLSRRGGPGSVER